MSPEARNFVAIGIGARDEALNGAFAQPRLNGQPLEFLAPVVFRLEGHGIGLRAAILHAGSERARLVGAALALLGAGVIWLAGVRMGRALLGIPSLAQARVPGGRRFFFYPWLVAAFLAGRGASLIIEFVPPKDPRVRQMLAMRDHSFPDYHQDGFERAFGRHFSIDRSAQIEDSRRVLYLMTRR